MKTTYIVTFALFFSIFSFAQKLDKEKIEALKIAHITSELNLTEKQAQVFWPIYNEKEATEDQLREKSFGIRNKNTADLTETEAKSLLLDILEIEKQKQQLHAKFVNDLLQIMPAKKIIMLHQAERSFKRKMIEQFKLRHKEGRR